MKQHKRLCALLLAFASIGTLGFWSWKKGTPYQAPYWSPNRQYYIQKYSNHTLSGIWASAPGHGSDGIDGYIRLYDRNRRLVHERFEFFIRDIDPVWAGNEVYLRGVAQMDRDPWILPSSSE
jgi:hypothetical protein